MNMTIPLSQPDITEKERKYVNEVMNTTSLSLGPKLSMFEEKLSQFLGTKYAVAVNSGTSALHLCIKAAGIGPGDYVITTPFSFISSSNCILFENAQPLFVDIDPLTLNIDTDKIEELLSLLPEPECARVKAILPVHVFGYPCNMDEIIRIARKYNLIVIEDSCEAVGAEYKLADNGEDCRWRKVGGIGDMGVLAFYPNKQMTTGEGGVIVTDSYETASLCKSLRNQGRQENGTWLVHERLGYNYRMSDINCALGIAQIERINEILDKRKNVADLYNERLKNFELIQLPPLPIPEKLKNSWFVYVVRLKKCFNKENRDNILENLINKGIGCNLYFPPIHLQPFYIKEFSYKPGDFHHTEDVSERTIALPFYGNLTEREINYVCQNLESFVYNEIKAADNNRVLSY